MVFICFTSLSFFFSSAYEKEREKTVMELKLRLNQMYSCPKINTILFIFYIFKSCFILGKVVYVI